MQFNKIKLHSLVLCGKAESQITLDDDYNVPDYRPDIVKVLKEKGELHFDEVKAAAGAAWLKGRLVFKILYRSDQENGKISCLRGEIPFQEKINMDGLQEFDPVTAAWEIEDLTIGVIHSRKISVRAVILLQVEEQKEKEEELCAGVEDLNECEQKYRMTKVTQLVGMKHDICRQKSEIALPSSKPNVQEILWKSLELRNLNTRLDTEGVKLGGEVLICVLYREEEENDRLQWYETMLPLDCGVDSDILQGENIIYKIKAKPMSMELEVKPDYDGEERVLVVELAINVDIRAWREEEVQILEDAYSLQKDIIPVRTPAKIERIAVKNDSQCRLSERMEIPQSQEKILQICSCEGTVHLEKKEMTAKGVKAEGILVAELLYITTDDKMPVAAVREIYPFEQLIEIPNVPENLNMELESRLSQMSAVMLDQDHVEIKAVIDLDLLAFGEETIQNITELKEEPLDMEWLQSRPGLIGYVVKAGDSLWTIARENHTTVDEIKKNNNLSSDTINRGQKLLIVKKVS